MRLSPNLSFPFHPSFDISQAGEPTTHGRQLPVRESGRAPDRSSAGRAVTDSSQDECETHETRTSRSPLAAMSILSLSPMASIRTSTHTRRPSCIGIPGLANMRPVPAYLVKALHPGLPGATNSTRAEPPRHTWDRHPCNDLPRLSFPSLTARPSLA